MIRKFFGALRFFNLLAGSVGGNGVPNPITTESLQTIQTESGVNIATEN